MLYYLTAAGLVAHTFFWGLGLAWLILSWGWRRWWWVFAPGLGLALQSAVVWAGAHTSLQGTNQYGWWTELLPVGLAVLAVFRSGFHGAWKRLASLGRAPAVSVAAIMVVGGWFLLSPMAAAGQGLSSSSLGSCDHADYAAGARVLAEFSRYDREGMMGLTEVTHVGSVDYFFDFWLRLNHFTPSALIAFQSTIFGLEAYRLVSVFAAGLLLLNVPLVFWLARVVAGMSGAISWVISFLYTISPLSAYAVHQGALGQILAAHGIALLVVTVALLFREAGTARALWRLGALVLAAFWLLAGSYNFILTVCLAQAVLWLVLQGFAGASRRKIVRVAGVLAGALAVCMILFWPRFAGIAERFQMFAEHDYGWGVPLLTWEGWLGLVSNVYLEPYAAGVRGWIMASLVVAWVILLFRRWRGRMAMVIAPVALVLPVVCGWTVLAWESLHRANASYDAFKLISVFYPGLLAGLGAVLFDWRQGRWTSVAVGLIAVVVVFNLIRAEEFRETMSRPPLRVDAHLAGLRRVETMTAVASVNVRVNFYWARLWADAFLLRTPHYFEEVAYEGRNITPLRGTWDLRLPILRVYPVRAADKIDLGRNFYLVRPAAVAQVTADFGPGWNAYEHFGTDQWRWTTDAGQIVLSNTRASPVMVSVRFLVAGVGVGETLEVDCEEHGSVKTILSATPDWSQAVALLLPPGRTALVLRPAKQTYHAVARDERRLGVALHSMELQLLDN
jgi:hypothetical protein